MRIDEKSEHEKQFVQSEAGRRKKHYEAPILTLLRVDPARADLLDRAITGDRNAEEQLGPVQANPGFDC
jgi:hypothetical protein